MFSSWICNLLLLEYRSLMNPSSLISEKLLRFRQKLDEGEVLMVKFERLDCGENSSVLVRRGAKPAGSTNLNPCDDLESSEL